MPTILRKNTLLQRASLSLFFLSALITGAYCRSILRGTCFVSKGFSSTHVPQTDAKAPQLEQLGSKSFDLMMFMFLTGVATNHS
jgi:hypothetical protein